MSLAIFDLDNTLIADDSDYLWGQFLVERGIVESDYYQQANDRFYEQYRAGTLDIAEFLRFALKPLSEHNLASLQNWHSQFLQEKIAPIVLPAARALVDQHRSAGDTLLVITATNEFVTKPIVKGYFNIPHLIAPIPEFDGNAYTGDFTGIPSFQQGKVLRLREWLKLTGHDLQGSWFYSDSHNDLPLLELVEHPVAVDPDPQLTVTAQQRGWQIISLRNGSIPVPHPEHRK